MSALADEPCEACTSDDEPLTAEGYAAFLTELDGAVWEVVDEHHLRGSYDFDDFGAALGFAVEVGTVADREWHHPDLTVSWGHVEVVIYTHKIDGLHRSDFVLAAKMDARYGG